MRKNVETETYAREKSWSIFIVATPAPPLAVTRDPAGLWRIPFPATSNLPINPDIYIDIYLRGSFCSPRFSEKNLRRENDKFYYAVDPSQKFFRFFILSLLLLLEYIYIYFEKVSRDIISRKFRNLSFQVEPSGRFNRIGDKLCSNFSILV